MKKTIRLAVITARGGSKRLPRKNIMPFAGRPMIAWTIDAARDSSCFDRILVSTDDAEIAEVARECGLDVPFLRQQAADDVAPISQAVVHAVEQCREGLGEDYERVTLLMPNCPLRTAQDIRDAHAAFDSRDASFQLSCFRFGWMNPWWAMKLDHDGIAEPIFPDALTARSQDLPPLYCPTGAIWIARTEALMAAGTFYGPGRIFHPLPWQSAVDIDDAEDFEFAKAVLESGTPRR